MKTRNPIKKWLMDLNRELLNKEIQMTKKIFKSNQIISN